MAVRGIAALPTSALLLDVWLTLHAQQAGYWANNRNPNETFVLAYYALAVGPTFFALLAILSAAAMLVGSRYLPLWFSAPVSSFFFAAHVGASSGHIFHRVVALLHNISSALLYTIPLL